MNVKQTRMISAVNRFFKYVDINFPEFLLNESGVCSGLATRYLLNKGRGTEYDFLDNIKRIIRLKKSDYKKEASWVADFSQQVEYAFSPEKYKKGVQQGEIDKIFHDNDSKVEGKYSLGVVLAKEKVNDVLRRIVQPNLMVYLAGNKHAIAAYFKEGIYYLFDPNSATGEKQFTNSDDFANEVLNNLFVEIEDKSLGIRVKVFAYKSKSAKTDAELRAIFPTKAELAAAITPDLDPGYADSLMLACINEDVEMVDELLKLGADPFREVEPNLTAFTMACRANHEIIVNKFLAKVDDNTSTKTLYGGLTLALVIGMETVSQQLLTFLAANRAELIRSHLNELFYSACTGGNLELVKRILELIPDRAVELLTAANASGYTPIMFAAKTGSEKVINYLLSQKSVMEDKKSLQAAFLLSIEHGQYSSFQRLGREKACVSSDVHMQAAVEHNQPRIIMDILKTGTKLTMAHLQLAVKHGHFRLVKQLLSQSNAFADADKLKIKMLEDALIKGNKESLQELLRSESDNDFSANLIYLAAVHGEADFVMSARDLGYLADENKLYKALITACHDGDLEAVYALTLAGANINQKVTTENDRHKGKTPIQIAMTRGHADVVRWILDNGFHDPSGEITQSIMRSACMDGEVELVSDLISRGLVDCNAKIKNKTPLEIAAIHYKADMVNTLLDAGADPKLTGGGGKRLLMRCCTLGRVDLVEKVIKKLPPMKDVITEKDIDAVIEKAAQNGAHQTIEAAIAMQPLLQHTPSSAAFLRAALLSACENGRGDAANLLIEKLSQMKEVVFEKDYLEKLAKAYQYKLSPTDKPSDTTFLQIAYLSGHHGIYNLIVDKNRYITELRDNPRPSAATVKGFFSQHPMTALILACKMGDIDAVKRIIEIGKFDYRQPELDPLIVAANYGQRDIVSYFMKDPTFDLQVKLVNAVKNKNWYGIAVILELLHPQGLNPEIETILIKHRKDIHEAYFSEVLFKDKLVPREDAKERGNNVYTRQNALGMLLYKDAIVSDKNNSSVKPR